MINQNYNTYRHYYYYGSLLARRGDAAMNCPGVMII